MEYRRALALVAAALVLCFGALAAVVVLSRSEDGVAVDALLSEELTSQIARSEALGRDVVDFAALTDFPWQRLYLIDPGTPRQAVDDALGFDFDGELNFTAGKLLIFVDDGRLARFADYRGEGRFEGIERPIAAFDRAQARFAIADLVLRPR